MKIFAIIVALLMVNTAQSAQKFYKWVDEEGNTHYSSEKPEDRQTDEVKVKTKQPKVSQLIENDSNDIDSYREDLNTAEEKTYMEKHYEKKQLAKELAKENKKLCLDAKAAVAKFQEQVRMSRVDTETGQKVYLDDSKRADIIKKAQNEVKKYCR
jgi:hypothetical protein